MKEYIYSVMTGKKEGAVNFIVRAILHIASWFYAMALGLIKFSYRSKLLRAQKPACKVISIGNISLGGTGKTPTACMFANMLKDQKRKVAVLTRGYGEDEWKMLKDTLSGMPVVVGPDRVRNSNYAISKFGVDTIILDDGFQHWRIKRDLDVVLIDSSNPFGNGYLFPRGVLREAPTALKRADVAMLTKVDMEKSDLEQLKKQLNSIAPDLPILESVHNPKYLYRLLDKKTLELSEIKAKPIACLSSIVNTEYFEFLLNGLGSKIKMRFHYPDHYRYRSKDIDYIVNECKKSNIETIVTTEKDAYKLKTYNSKFKDLNVLVLHVELKVTKGEEILNRRFSSLYRD